MMRIITGKAKGTRLETLAGDATRPTAERVKEALFSMLADRVQGARVLDLFGGSGQLALEALSRGAEYAYLCDSARDAVCVIGRNVEKTRLTDCTVLCCDWRRALDRLAGEDFDLIFLDPPYKLGLIPQVLTRIAQLGLCGPGGMIVCEDERLEPHTCPGFTVYRYTRYGRICLTLLQKEGEDA